MRISDWSSDVCSSDLLWNDIEAIEKRKDAQLAREVEFAIPREMIQAQGIKLARDFVQREFVDAGMVADLNVHWDIGAHGLAKPHAHEIGRASCRASGGQYVYISVIAG